MYCPKCAAQNPDEACFCRSCGMDIGFVSERLSGTGKGEEEASDIRANPTTFEDMFGGMFNMQPIQPLQPIKPINLRRKKRRGATGDFANIAEGRSARREKPVREPRLDRAIVRLFIGIGLLLVAPSILIFVPDGREWWFWMFIPAFAWLGKGVAEYVRYRLAQQAHRVSEVRVGDTRERENDDAGAMNSRDAAGVAELPPHVTAEMHTPPSVTEATTRHLGAEDRVRAAHAAPRRKKRSDA